MVPPPKVPVCLNRLRRNLVQWVYRDEVPVNYTLTSRFLSTKGLKKSGPVIKRCLAGWRDHKGSRVKHFVVCYFS